MWDRVRIAFVVLLAIASPQVSSAQHMFLDTNGDGLSSSADAVNPTGPTTLDVWLRTDTNRDGTPGRCPTEDGPLTLFAYEFILRASNGTVAWSGFVNRQPGISLALGEGASSTDYHNGRGAGGMLSPGTYLLASITVEISTGTPGISIVSSTPLSASYFTAFASSCSGNDFDSTLKLSSDWFDADGVPYGGQVNSAPLLAQPAPMTVAERTVQEQDLHATDAEGHAVSFSLVSGPPYVSIATIDPGSGAGLGRIRLAPGNRDAGTAEAIVAASDGLLSDRKTLAITVTDVNTAPTLTPLGDISMREGELVVRPLLASDPDGDTVTFARKSGPEYVTVTSTLGIPPAGSVRIAPSYADAGSAMVTISASDGFLTDEKSFRVTVSDPYPVHNQLLCQPAGMLVPSGSVLGQTLHAVSPDGAPVTFLKQSGPDFLTVTTVSSSPTSATGFVRASPSPAEVGSFAAVVAATDGMVTDSRSLVITVGDARSLPPADRLYDAASFIVEVGSTPQSLAAADMDGDGILDLVTANLSHSLTILRGRGDGTFDRRQDFPVGATPYSATLADMNRDGRPDLVLVDSTLDVVSVIDATGACSFGHRRDFKTGNRPAHVNVGDWNADLIPDLAVTDEGDNSISILIGAGDGTFVPRTAYRIGGDPCYSDDGDFNGDGRPDLVTANESTDNLSVLLGNGDGTFGEGAAYGAGLNPRSVKVADFNGDGRVDIAAANFWGHTVSILIGNGDGTFQPQTQFVTGSAPWSMAVGDVNGDGRPDVVTADVGESGVSVLLAEPSGSLAGRVRYPAGFLARFVVLGDANGDGHLDILVSSEGGNNVVTLLGDGRGAFRTGESHDVGDRPQGLAAADWNGDGRDDLAVSNVDSRTISIFLTQSDGSLTPAQDIHTTAAPSHLVPGDWNSDGKVDLVAGSLTGPSLVTMFLGEGTGGFGPGTGFGSGGNFPTLRAGDFDGDGRLDLIALNNGVQGLSVLLGGPGGTLVERAGISVSGTPSGIDVGDLNRDGRQDLVVARNNPSGLDIMLGDGSGAFAPGARIELEANRQPAVPRLADLNGDGILDLAFCTSNPYVFEGGHALNVSMGAGDGGFGPIAALVVGAFQSDLAALDANGDGRIDLAVVHETVGMALFLGLGNGQFAPKIDFGVGAGISRIVGVDLSGTGRVDLALNGFLERRLIVLRNRGTFHPVDLPPVVLAPEAVGARAGARVEFIVTAVDPDGDAIAALTADLSGLPADNDAAFTASADRTSGTFSWRPGDGEVGTFSVHFVASNSRSGSATTRIDVGPPNRPPVAAAGGPYLGTVEVPVQFDGSGSTDPDGDPLSMSWEFGDGKTGSGERPLHAYSAEGDYQVTLHVNDGFSAATDSAGASIRAFLSATAFPAPGSRVIHLFQRFGGAYFQLEPVARSFALRDVDIASIVLRTKQNDPPVEIRPSAGKRIAIRDRNHNGVHELSLFFGQRDLRTLFGWIIGRKNVPLTIEGALQAGTRFRAELEVTVHGYHRFPHVHVVPNPMNPDATFTVATALGGHLRATLFDARGRLVRRMLDAPHAAPGLHEIRFDGRAEGGSAVASGIYFYRVETVEGTTEGRVVVLR